MPEMGHTRQDLIDRPLKFWNVYSYLIVYDPATSPLAVVAILHGRTRRRTVAQEV
jgi:plasmid stabilization system protein ParE